MTEVLAIVIVIFIAWAIRKSWVVSAGRKRRELQELVRRRREDAERQELFSYGQTAKRAEEYRRMQKLRKEAGAPILDLPGDDETKTCPGDGA